MVRKPGGGRAPIRAPAGHQGAGPPHQDSEGLHLQTCEVQQQLSTSDAGPEVAHTWIACHGYRVHARLLYNVHIHACMLVPGRLAGVALFVGVAVWRDQVRGAHERRSAFPGLRMSSSRSALFSPQLHVPPAATQPFPPYRCRVCNQGTLGSWPPSHAPASASALASASASLSFSLLHQPSDPAQFAILSVNHLQGGAKI